MSVEQVFRASDGTNHKTKAAAEKHDVFMAAVKDFHESGDQLKNCFVETAVTGDGKPFDTRQTTYYHISHRWSVDGPHVQPLYIHPWNMRVDVERERIILRDYRSPERGREGYYVDYPIDELFTTEKAAEAEVTRILQERLTQLTKRLAGPTAS